MAYKYNWNCPPCGRPPYSGPWGPPPDRPPYPGPWGPPGRPPYPGTGGGPGRPPYPGPGGGPGRPPYPEHRGMVFKSDNENGSYETEQKSEQDDLYMTDMQEPGQMEEDWLYMKQLYPNTARKLLHYIEDAADRLEYENSLMFDAYPDRIAVEQVVKEIIAVIQENEPALLTIPEADPEQNEDQTWSGCAEEMIQVMLLGEMHHRRWRYQQMNRRNY